MKMFTSWQFFLFFIIFGVIDCENYSTHSDLLNGIINMFKNMNVHTIWTTTCWDTSVNREFLMKLSNEDISVNFKLKNMAIVHQTQNAWFKSGILVDLSCDQASSVLQQASNRRLYNLQNEWILFDRHGNPDKTDSREIASHSFRTFMNQSYAMPDSRVYLLIEVGRHVWEVWDGFRSSVADQVRVSKVGVMTPDRVEFKHSDRTDFRRAVLSASTVILEPNSFRGWDRPILNHNLDSFAHMHYAICTMLAEQLNFTLNLTFSTDYGWNYGNGTYSGLIGQLQRKEIDFTAAGGLMRSDRMDVGELTVGTFVARTVAIYRQPPLSSVNNIFALPFVLNVWIVMFVVMSVFIVALILATWVSNRLHGEETRLSVALDTITLVLGAICQQGLSVASVHYSIAVRMATFMLFLCAVFLFTSYAACIVVLLQSASQTISNIGDLINKPITLTAQDSIYNYIYFNEPTDENMKKIYLKKMKPQGARAFTSPEIGLERVRNEFHSYLVEISSAHHIIAKTWQEHEKCSLSEMELYKIPLLTLYVVKKSGYKDVFKQKMIQQHEIGLKHRIVKKIMPQKQKCISANSGIIRFDSVSMREIYPALLVLGYGICASWLLFLFEHIYKSKWINNIIM